LDPKTWLGISTDDGADSPGFHHLLDAMAGIDAELQAFAPAESRPSLGTSLAESTTDVDAARGVLRATNRVSLEVFDLSPAGVARVICARALRVQGADPRRTVCMVVGVNCGPNVGEGVIHSGTFCAGLIASWSGIRAVTISLDDVFSVNESDPGPLRFAEAAAIGRCAVGYVLDAPSPVLCHINVPNSISVGTIRFEAATCFRNGSHLLRGDVDVLKDGNVSVTVFPTHSLRVSARHSRHAAVQIGERWDRTVRSPAAP
jgi:5'-nucleotidase